MVEKVKISILKTDSKALASYLVRAYFYLITQTERLYGDFYQKTALANPYFIRPKCSNNGD